jgi:hypothetical protein
MPLAIRTWHRACHLLAPPSSALNGRPGACSSRRVRPGACRCAEMTLVVAAAAG